MATSSRPSTYDREAVEHMWKELEAIGVNPLTSEKAVHDFLKGQKGCSLVVVNSVCGCAAGNARPGVAIALQNRKIPDRSGTVFAGVDKDAVDTARGYFTNYKPSSPSITLLKDGKVALMLERKDIEGHTSMHVAKRLVAAFDEHCSAEGPSVAEEKMKKVFGL